MPKRIAVTKLNASTMDILNTRRVQYPVTIQYEDLRMASLDMQGVQDLIARIVDAAYTAWKQKYRDRFFGTVVDDDDKLKDEP